MTRFLRLLTALLLGTLLVACASGGGARRDVTAAHTLPPPDTTAASGAYEGASDYRIGAQDLLAVSVFGVQDLNKEVRVNASGQITLPLIGAVMAGGKTVPELEAELARKYADGFIQNPQVSVFVKEFTSQRVTLEGATTAPTTNPQCPGNIRNQRETGCNVGLRRISTAC